MNTILLNGYTARIKDSGKRYLEFGTYGSYGKEKISLELGEDWADLDVYATFISPKKAKKTVKIDPLVDYPVPKMATIGKCGYGAIVFAGYKDEQCIVTCDVPYYLKSHTDISGDESLEEDPTLLDQIMRLAKQIEFLISSTKGGKKGQVAVKLSDEPGDIGWQDIKQSEGTSFIPGSGLKYDPQTTVLSVDVAGEAEKDNTKPISSAAVNTIVGNIGVLLGGI